MSNHKELTQYLQRVEAQLSALNAEKLTVIRQMDAVKSQAEEDEIQQAIKDGNWKRLLQVNDKHQTTQSQDDFWAAHVKIVNKIFNRAGYYTHSKQMSFKLSMIDYAYNKDQIKKLGPILFPIIQNLDPVKIHKDVKPFKVIPIFDKNKGSKGSYSLIINEKGDCAVYCENKTKPEIRNSFGTLESSLIYIAKKHYFFG